MSNNVLRATSFSFLDCKVFYPRKIEVKICNTFHIFLIIISI